MGFRNWTIAAVSLFAIGLVLGLTVHGAAADFIMRDIGSLKQLSATLQPFHLSTALFIWVKNVTTLLLSFVLSPILCLMPILALIFNGWLLSLVSVLVAQQKSVLFVLVGVLPHGIIEIPALIIGEAAALSFGVSAITGIISEKHRARFKPYLRRDLRYLVFAGLLLVPAALIETYVTPLFIR